ncbi:O-methylsterigmatocystin oxidoreductase Short=OMST oxidoreductase [Rhizoctonia solani AG-1 IB]|uniref:O-methylsterigmatocystin oxidoreductase Short=OMST oxidoreductase n=1 Tax=Thanatephorus cucumeris (strain AG1-IB / isolate 7/3/14) TaxID=1108050 RepID=M5CAR1_THACB|nr:O-methylsterigmatocystin oxidoreductase Short=OMST oxidoreductase [Rhizoctonia solani AG-1 IB]
MDHQTTLYAGLSMLGLALIQHYWSRGFGRKARHPPSPWSLPFLGNLFSLPPGLDHLAYLELGKKLKSNIFYLNMMGQPIIVLNNAQAASDLFEKRSALYSDRTGAAMVNHPSLLDWSNFAGMLPYSDHWRRQRRRMNNWLNIRAVRQFDSLQEDVVKRLLGRLLDVCKSPEPFEEVKNQFFFAMGSATFQLAYGYHLKNDQDPFYLDAVLALHRIFDATMSSNFLVNVFPTLVHVPDWLPWTGWKKTAREWREHKNHAIAAPYEWTKRKVASGDFEPSVLSSLLLDHEIDQGLSTEERDNELKELAYMLFVGGTDTSATALVNFVAAMVVNPEAQTKAQAEIDSVLGYASRLPTMADASRMPYVRNLIQEVLRWHPVAPTGGTPHTCYQDDVYEGYDIQKGTIVVGNIWAMSHDDNVYKDPDNFDPNRFSTGSVPIAPAFGWGRRKCPGMHFAEASLFLAITSLLATFRFSRKKNESGNEIVPTIKGAFNSLVVLIKPFEFELHTRSEKHRQLIIENTRDNQLPI